MIIRVRMPRFAKRKKQLERLASVHSYNLISVYFPICHQLYFIFCGSKGTLSHLRTQSRGFVSREGASLIFFHLVTKCIFFFFFFFFCRGYPFAPGHERS